MVSINDKVQVSMTVLKLNLYQSTLLIAATEVKDPFMLKYLNDLRNLLLQASENLDYTENEK